MTTTPNDRPSGSADAPRAGGSAGTGGGGRRRARAAALQALYQWDMTGQGDTAEIEAWFVSDWLAESPGGVDVEFFHDILHGVTGSGGKLDRLLEPILDRSLDRVDPIERALLRLGAFELAERMEIPAGVAINEAVELAKTFGGENGHRYVNGVLDRLAKAVRPDPGDPGS